MNLMPLLLALIVCLTPVAYAADAEGTGSAFVEDKDGNVLRVTGGTVSAIAKDSVMIGDKPFAITRSTKVCTQDGKRTSLQSIRVGNKILATTQAGETATRTLRVGSLSARIGPDGGMKVVDNYSCK